MANVLLPRAGGEVGGRERKGGDGDRHIWSLWTGVLGSGWDSSRLGGDHLEAEIMGPMVLPVTECFFFGEEGAGFV